MYEAGWQHDFVENIFNEADIDGDGTITLNEWIVTFVNKNQLIDERKLRIIFDILDADKGGTLSTGELKLELQKSFGEFTTEEWRCIVDEVDIDGDGTVDFIEF